MTLYGYVILLIAVALFFKYKVQKHRKLKKFAHFFTVPSQPFIGNLKFLSSNMQERVSILLNLMKVSQFPLVIWIFNIPLVIVGSGDNIQTVLYKSKDRGLMRFFKHFFRDGILLNSGEKWRKSRRTADPMFSASTMQRYLKIFNQHSAKLTQKFKSFESTDASCDVWNYLAYLNLDIIFDNMADYQSNLIQNEDKYFIQLLERGARLGSLRYTQPLLFLDFINNAYLYVTGQWKIYAKIEEFIDKIVRARIEDSKFNQSHQAEDLQEAEKKTQTLLDALIKTHQTDPTYTFDCLKDDFLDIIMAGSMTTARATCFALLMLAIHQDVQEKLYQEINSIFGNTTRPVEMNDLNQLDYLDQCVKETLRKYPVIPLFFRKSSEDIVLNAKQTIPASTNIVILTMALHHDPQLYPNPESWDPDRFAPEVADKRGKLAFLPFGTGPQSCIGAKYAMISLKTQLVHLLRSYRFETDMTMDDVKLYIDVVLKSVNGFWLKLRPRESENS